MANNILAMGFLIFFLFIFFLLHYSEAQTVPAMYVFGDSLVDVGNNNHLSLSLAKANFPHNGIDFPGRKPTGRFCNGRNAADFIGNTINFCYTMLCVYIYIYICMVMLSLLGY